MVLLTPRPKPAQDRKHVIREGGQIPGHDTDESEHTPPGSKADCLPKSDRN
jgi:hypothetical protein